MESPLSDFERLPRNSPPRPRAEFTRDLERSLVRSVQPRRKSRSGWWQLRSRRILTAGSLAGAIATMLLVLAVAGVRPFGASGTNSAQADRECSTVERLMQVRRPLFTLDAQGRPHVSYRVESVWQPVIRCR
jgi:hypothetical protein